MSQSVSAIAIATDAEIASCPRIGGQVPMRPWRCSLMAFSSYARISTMLR